MEILLDNKVGVNDFVKEKSVGIFFSKFPVDQYDLKTPLTPLGVGGKSKFLGISTFDRNLNFIS